MEVAAMSMTMKITLMVAFALIDKQHWLKVPSKHATQAAWLLGFLWLLPMAFEEVLGPVLCCIFPPRMVKQAFRPPLHPTTRVTISIVQGPLWLTLWLTWSEPVPCRLQTLLDPIPLVAIFGIPDAFPFFFIEKILPNHLIHKEAIDLPYNYFLGKTSKKKWYVGGFGHVKGIFCTLGESK